GEAAVQRCAGGDRCRCGSLGRPEKQTARHRRRKRMTLIHTMIAMFSTCRTPLTVALTFSVVHLVTHAAMAAEIAAAEKSAKRPNVLFIISDDLTATALSCYGNSVCSTPNIDRLAAESMRFTRAFCNGTYCGPSRASFLSGYYPHATGVLGYTSPRPAIGDRATWPQHFKNAGYYTARVSKIYHMGVPGGIEYGGDGRDHND